MSAMGRLSGLAGRGSRRSKTDPQGLHSALLKVSMPSKTSRSRSDHRRGSTTARWRTPRVPMVAAAGRNRYDAVSWPIEASDWIAAVAVVSGRVPESR